MRIYASSLLGHSSDHTDFRSAAESASGHKSSVTGDRPRWTSGDVGDPICRSLLLSLFLSLLLCLRLPLLLGGMQALSLCLACTLGAAGTGSKSSVTLACVLGAADRPSGMARGSIPSWTESTSNSPGPRLTSRRPSLNHSMNPSGLKLLRQDRIDVPMQVDRLVSERRPSSETRC
jgi:hypothetical protein